MSRSAWPPAARRFTADAGWVNVGVDHDTSVAEVASRNPPFRLVGVAVGRPFIGERPQVVVQDAERLLRHHAPVVGCPPLHDGVEHGDYRPRVGSAQGASLRSEPFPDSPGGCLGWFDQKLAVVAADVESQEVEPGMSDMDYPGLLLVEGQAPGRQPLGKLRFDVFGLPLGVA